jgi:hypothetical protein
MNMRKLTKAQQSMVWSYDNARYSTLEQAYKTPSQAKISAFNDILFEMKRYHGTGMRITGRSCNFFSCAYKYYDEAQQLHLRYHYPTRVEDFVLVGNE